MRHLLPLLVCAPLAAVDITGDAAGVLHLGDVGTIGPSLFDEAWQYRSAVPAGDPAAEIRGFSIPHPGGGALRGTAAFTAQGDAIACRYVLTADRAMTCNALMVAFDLPTAEAGSAWKVDDKTGALPLNGGEPHLIATTAKAVSFTLATLGGVSFEFAEPTQVLIQDNRRWGPGFTLRMGPQPISLAAGQSTTIAFTLRCASGAKLTQERPVTLAAGPDWIPLTHALDVEPGSVLDWSKMGFTDAPAGKHGRVVAKDGAFAFADKPSEAKRFYGVNLCFTAQYLDHALADTLADRLVRSGYNTLRIHHYEGELTGGKPTLDWSPEKLDQFDYLTAALIKRGIYLTTDLYVSRPVAGGKNPKVMIPVDEAAFQDWRAFVRKFLGHVNPYTKRSYAEEPALAWLVMINEGNLGNYWHDIKALPEWSTAWDAWRAKRGLPKLAFPDDFRRDDVSSFLADTERAAYHRMAAVVKDEMKCAALLSNANGWTTLIADQGPRQDYDYADDHFYIDHPRFLEREWTLPSACDNRNPLRGGSPGGGYNAFVRPWGKPFTISEYNYSAPGRYRGVGGMLTGALGALQGWSSIWRFAYSHSRDAVAEVRPMGYFDIASDPLNTAAERAAVLLYLRGDLAPATTKLSLVLPPVDPASPARAENLAPAWTYAAWSAQVGTGTGGTPVPRDADDATVRAALGNARTGLAIDPAKGTFTLDTPRLAGGFAEKGGSITAGTALRVDRMDQTASLTVAALDGKPLATSDRLLLTHLTDVQNTGARYAEQARRTLLAWGVLPHLAAAGSARVSFATSRPLQVWALTMAGKRAERIPAQVVDGRLEFTVAVAAPEARLYYELAPQ